VIKGCAREAGERTKIAVQSRDRDVDSVGACVGMKGMRVQSIIRELRGEKIDIIEYSEDAVVFATHALSPAKVSRISILDPVEKHMEVIVDDSQLSLAIGKKGQNVRLAAKLLGWKIDIKSEEEKRQEVESQMAALVAPGAPVSVLIDYGLGEEVVAHLVEAGVGTIEKLGGMTPEELEAIPGMAPMVQQIQQAVIAYYSQFEEPGPEAGDSAPEQNQPEAQPVSPDLNASAEEAAEMQGTEAGELEAEPGPEEPELPETISETHGSGGLLYDTENPEERFEPGSEQELAETEASGEQFGRIEDAGSPTQNQPEGAGSKDTPKEGHGG
jgi:transcription termination/antitermination protein NusA